MDTALLKIYYLRIFSTTSLSVFFFLAGLYMHTVGIIRDLKISIIVILCFVLIFIHKKPCIFQLSCLLCISFVQGALFSALFVFLNKVLMKNLITGIFSTITLTVCLFGITYYCDKQFKLTFGFFSQVLFYSCLTLCFVLKFYDADLPISSYHKIVFLLMLGMLMISLQDIYCSNSIMNRNYVLDSLVIEFCMLQVLIRLLHILR